MAKFNPYVQIKRMSNIISGYKQELKELKLTAVEKKLLHRIIGEHYYDATDKEKESFDSIMCKLRLDTVEK